MREGPARAPHPLRVSVRSLVRGFRPHHPRLRRAARRILAAEGLPGVRLSLVFLPDRTMARVNHEFTGRAGSTDVLAFDLRGPPAPPPAPTLDHEDEVKGEVLVSIDRAREQARMAGIPLREEVARLVIHGLLHLAGYEHEKSGDRRRMRGRESRLLAEEAQGWGWLRK